MTSQKGPNQRVKTFFRPLLWPFSTFYGALTSVRNHLYEAGGWPSRRAPLPTLSVGNLTVGGTGKTPHVEYLVGLLGTRFRLATLSRGYGRHTRGFRLADATDTAQTLGDEPMQMHQKFGGRVVVAVGEKRVEALQRLHERHPDRQLVLLDDAFQHRALRPDLNLLLTDYHRPFYADDPFPGGRLRERRSGADRADAVIVTKCPVELGAAERGTIDGHIRRYARPGVPIFYSTLAYGTPVALGGGGSWAEPVLLVSGLANADSLEAYARQAFQLTEHRRFPDHHAYTAADWQRVRATAHRRGARGVLTTEKDAVKLKSLLPPHELADCPVFYLPITVTFLFGDTGRFEGWILDQIERVMTNRPPHSAPAA